MLTIEMITDILESHDFTVREYHEEGVLCGYEIERHTNDLGIDILHFLDCRDSGVTPENLVHALNDVYYRFDVDGEAVEHYNYYPELQSAGLQRILDDMDDHESALARAIIDINKEA